MSPHSGNATPGRSRALAKEFLKEVNYPHSMHPALVPGVSIEDQRVRYGVDRRLFVVVGSLIVAFIVWGIAAPTVVLDTSSAALGWVMTNLGWVFNSLAALLMVFLIVLACTRYGRIPLGLDGDKAEYSTASWTAMLFAAGIGIGIIFFGTYEPLSHYLSPLPGAYEAASDEALRGALVTSAFHWGINAWAIYAVVGLSVAYASYRRGRVPLMSSVLAPLFGDRGTTTSLPSRIIDGLAIIATLFGTAASLGIGAMQIAHGTEIVTGIGTTGNTLAMMIIVLLTIGTIISAVSGIAKGIRMLSNINMILAVGLAIFVFVAGPTALLANLIPGVITDYIGSLPSMLSANMADGAATEEFLSSWTTFYWAWWVSWAPFVGVFVAKISRGRTIRQFVLGVLFIPSTIIVVAFVVLGGTAIWVQRTSGTLAPDGTASSLPAPESSIFSVLAELPGGAIVAPIVVLMLAVFFITSADSASLVNSQFSQRGNPEPNRLITAFWAVCMAGIAVVILMFGGANALQGLQNLVVVAALPFAVVLVVMCVAMVRELRTDPLAIRDQYARIAVTEAVRHGVDEYGDDFALAVEQTDVESSYSVAAHFDSTAQELTEWYQRTDEDGNPVGYDYATGEYLDEDPGDGPAEGDGKDKA